MPVLDVGGEELGVGHVVSCPIPGAGDEVRGYVQATGVDDVRVQITAPRRLAGHSIVVLGANCTLQHGPNGGALRMAEVPGSELGLAEVEAA